MANFFFRILYLYNFCQPKGNEKCKIDLIHAYVNLIDQLMMYWKLICAIFFFLETNNAFMKNGKCKAENNLYQDKAFQDILKLFMQDNNSYRFSISNYKSATNYSERTCSLTSWKYDAVLIIWLIFPIL